jgi:RNA polymerase sigma factor (sigma-70 family)
MTKIAILHVDDVRVEFRVRNNLILRQMEQLDIASVAELSRKMAEAGISITYQHLVNLVNMRFLPEGKTGRWLPAVEKMATFFRCLPEDLFSNAQRTAVFTQNRAEAEMTFAAALAVDTQSMTPLDMLERKQFQQSLTKMLQVLPPRMERVLRLRFGLDGNGEHTLEEIGDRFGLDKESIRRLEALALRRLSRPDCRKTINELAEQVGVAPRKYVPKICPY